MSSAALTLARDIEADGHRLLATLDLVVQIGNHRDPTVAAIATYAHTLRSIVERQGQLGDFLERISALAVVER